VGWLNSLAAPPNPIFERYHEILPELFGVAQGHLADAIVTEGEVPRGAFYVQAKPAAGSKCERCWRFTEDVGNDARYPTVCLRCADALEAINFSPYNKTEPQA
jgi:isoleucyl-tRNA synthetase